MSIDSSRSSGIGMSTRKDTRPITDPAYKTQCINKILDFLRTGYPHSLERRTLLTPSTKDFTNIFSVSRYMCEEKHGLYILFTDSFLLDRYSAHLSSYGQKMS